MILLVSMVALSSIVFFAGSSTADLLTASNLISFVVIVWAASAVAAAEGKNVFAKML
jgi:hypothetical protein